ncbi:MAG: class I SAM-dependent methyltransferase [Lachnospiraceae bacterium]|nr:class I SAM-dependent methyltransferase [Lachnospiraceae bacterium]
MRKCKLCGSQHCRTIYQGLIRNGGLGRYTTNNVPIYQCEECKVIWHDNQFDNVQQYYESKEYREELEGSSEADKFYELHDKETLDKLIYTGTDIYRNKVVADIGCGCGAFLDFLKGVSKEVIAVEPSETYRAIMDKKGFQTYGYMLDALDKYEKQMDVITSFDVIEHVEDPKGFIKDIYMLLKEGGKAIIGTPTDAPIMRKLLGDIYEKKLLFSTQHLWIFSEKNLKLIAEQEGFSKVNIKYFQRYGIGNMMGWIKDKGPGTAVSDEFITETLDNVWKSQCSEKGLADYIVLYLEK